MSELSASSVNNLSRLIQDPVEWREFLKISGITGRINLNKLPRMVLLCDGGELPTSLPPFVVECFLARSFESNDKKSRWLLLCTKHQATEIERDGYLERPAFLCHSESDRGYPVKILALGQNAVDNVELILVEQHDSYRLYYGV